MSDIVEKIRNHAVDLFNKISSQLICMGRKISISNVYPLRYDGISNSEVYFDCNNETETTSFGFTNYYSDINIGTIQIKSLLGHITGYSGYKFANSLNQTILDVCNYTCESFDWNKDGNEYKFSNCTQLKQAELNSIDESKFNSIDESKYNSVNYISAAAGLLVIGACIGCATLKLYQFLNNNRAPQEALCELESFPLNPPSSRQAQATQEIA